MSLTKPKSDEFAWAMTRALKSAKEGFRRKRNAAVIIPPPAANDNVDNEEPPPQRRRVDSPRPLSPTVDSDDDKENSAGEELDELENEGQDYSDGPSERNSEGSQTDGPENSDDEGKEDWKKSYLKDQQQQKSYSKPVDPADSTDELEDELEY